jgi:hypothetical protein
MAKIEWAYDLRTVSDKMIKSRIARTGKEHQKMN